MVAQSVCLSQSGCLALRNYASFSCFDVFSSGRGDVARALLDVFRVVLARAGSRSPRWNQPGSTIVCRVRVCMFYLDFDHALFIVAKRLSVCCCPQIDKKCYYFVDPIVWQLALASVCSQPSATTNCRYFMVPLMEVMVFFVWCCPSSRGRLFFPYCIVPQSFAQRDRRCGLREAAGGKGGASVV